MICQFRKAENPILAEFTVPFRLQRPDFWLLYCARNLAFLCCQRDEDSKHHKNMKNKIALITGGSRGLGKNMAIATAKKGIDLIITYNSNKEAADQVVKEIQSLGQKAKAFQLDTSDITKFDGFINDITTYTKAEYGTAGFDFLINNA